MRNKNITCNIPCNKCCMRLINFGVKLNNKVILENINLHIHCGELTAIMGPNGAGKTTLLKAMLGETPHSGVLRFVYSCNKNRPTMPRFGYVPQKIDIDPSSPISVLDLFNAALKKNPFWLLSNKIKLKEQVISMLSSVKAEHLINQKIGLLSGGEKQRVLLALALQPLPDILLLDEPTSSVDNHGTETFYKTVSQLRQEYHLSIIIVSHDTAAIASVADRIVVLNNTIIADDSPNNVLSNIQHKDCN